MNMNMKAIPQYWVSELGIEVETVNSPPIPNPQNTNPQFPK